MKKAVSILILLLLLLVAKAKSFNKSIPAIDNEIAALEKEINELTLIAKSSQKTLLLAKLEGKYPNLKRIINGADEVEDATLIKKIDEFVVTKDNRLEKLEELYNSKIFSLPAGNKRIPANTTPPFSVIENGQTVYFNRQGFPDFKPYSPGAEFEFRSQNLIGTGSATSGDFKAANEWAASNPALFGRFRLKPGSTQCEIKFGNDWVICSWHHYQDGRTMFPVPYELHSRLSHTGGRTIISCGLQDIFN